MLSDRLIRMIELHEDELTRALVEDLHANTHTPSYHRLSREAIRDRTYNVYKNLGLWLGNKAEEDIEAAYTGLGKARDAEGIPVSEVVYALILTKFHLRDYIRAAGLIDTAMDLYQTLEFQLLVGHFFDKAIYYTVRAFECAESLREMAGVMPRAR